MAENKLLPPAPSFDEGDDWEIYSERLQQFFVANPIEVAARKIAIFLTAVSPAVYKIIKNAAFPDTPDKKTFDQLIEICNNQFKAVVSIFAERMRFYESRQGDNESVTDWVTRVKCLAMQCDFQENMNFVLRDKFVTGLKKGPIMEKVFECKSTDDLSKCVNAALAREMTLKERAVFSTQAPVYKITANYKNSHNSSKASTSTASKKFNKNNQLCYACGKGDHDFKACKYKTYKCKLCNTVGHLAAMCKNRQKRNDTKPTMHQLDIISDTEECELYNVRTVSSVQNVNKFKVDLLVNSQHITFEIDSGAAVSVFSEEIYTKHFADKPLVRTGMFLRSYDSNIIKPLGSIRVLVRYGDNEFESDFWVVRNGGNPQVGRDILDKLGFSFVLNSIKLGNTDNLIKEFSELFNDELGCYKYGTIKFEVKKGTQPIFVKPRKVPIAYQESVNKEIDRLVSEGVLELVPNSDWGTPIVPILKKDSKSVRVCVDYKSTINPFLVDFKVPLPDIDDIFSNLCGGVYFSKLDMKNAYNQLQLEEDSQMLLAWSTHKGVYKCKRMSFGTKTACAHFQSTMMKTLQGCKGTACFYDDILVTGKTVEEHMENLRQVFTKLLEAGLRLNLNKCVFFQGKIKYLGHVIDKNGLHKDEDKIQAILGAPAPTNASEIKTFVGMINYYGRFFPNLAQVLAPFHNLLKKNVEFEWNDDCKRTFELVKQTIASDKVLVHFNSELPVKLICDASAHGVGAVLCHTMTDGMDRPIAFASKSLNKSQRNYSVIDREALAIFYGVKKFSHYILGRKFILQTDHKPLISIFGNKQGIPTMAASRLQRWSVYLANFDFKIEYITGKTNVNADFLSRLPTCSGELFNSHEMSQQMAFINFIDEHSPGLIDRKAIREQAKLDPIIVQVTNYVVNGWPDEAKSIERLKHFHVRKNELHLECDMLMWGHRVVIPAKLRRNILNELHSAHTGIVKMKSTARSYFWWPLIDKAIEDMANQCQQCVQSRPEQPKVPISNWPTTSKPMERVHIDHLGPVKGQTFFLITDSYSKWVEVFPVKSLSSKDSIIKLRETFARFGIAETIVSDNGTSFSSSEFKNFCVRNGIKHICSPPFHPQSNGAAENAVKSFKNGMQKAVNDEKNRGKPLDVLIARYLFTFRSSVHSATKETPYKRMFGREMNTKFDKLRPISTKEPNNRGKSTSNAKEKTFSIGEKVLVRDFSVSNNKWQLATVIGTQGSSIYVCQTELGQWKRHANQMMKSRVIESKMVNLSYDNDINFSCIFPRAGKANANELAAPVQAIDQLAAHPIAQPIEHPADRIQVEPRVVQDESFASASNISGSEINQEALMTSDSSQDEEFLEATIQPIKANQATENRTSNRERKTPNRLNYKSFKNKQNLYDTN